MIENFVLIVALIAVGSFMKRSKAFPDNTAEVLNSFILLVSLPAMILISIPKLSITEAIIYPVVSHWVFYFINLLLVWGVSKLLNFSKSVMGVLIVVSCLGNTAFLGIPVVGTFFGKSAIPYAVLYDQLGSAFAFILTMTFFIPIFTNSNEKFNLSRITFRLVKFPPFIALVVGFLFILF